MCDVTRNIPISSSESNQLTSLRPRSDLVPIPRHRAQALKWTSCRHPSSNNVMISSFVHFAPTAIIVTASQGSMGKCAGTDDSVLRQVPVPGNGARVLPLEVVPAMFARAPKKATFRLVPVPKNRAPGLNGVLVPVMDSIQHRLKSKSKRLDMH